MVSKKSLCIALCIIAITPLVAILCNCNAQEESIDETTVTLETIKEEETNEAPTIGVKELTHSNSSTKLGGSPVLLSSIKKESTEETTIEETEELITLTQMWVTEDVNFREEPDGTIINVIPQGTELTVRNYKIENEWSDVQIEDADGFIKSEFLSLSYVSPKPKYTYYYIVEGGIRTEMEHSIQEYGFDLIDALGIPEYKPYWMIQCYQETSSLTMTSPNSFHGGYYDWGIMQVWEGHYYDVWSPMYQTVHDYPNYKTDPYDNVHCGIIQFYQWYVKHNYDMVSALGSYLSGTMTPSQTYINDVLKHLPNLYSY